MANMNIGIIGAGNIGSALARRFRAAGHTVAIANSRSPESLAALAAETGATAVSVPDAARGKDLVVITIPQKNVPDLPRGLFADAANTIVVDTGNYYPRQRDGKIDGIELGMTESGWVEQQLGHSVIKAFNNIYAEHLQNYGKPAGVPGRIALPVAGDDPAAKQTVIRLIDEIGFDAVDAGKIEQSWQQQPGTPVYTNDYDAEGVRRALAQATPERTTEWGGTPNSPGTFEMPR